MNSVYICVRIVGVLTTLNKMRNLKEKMQERNKFKSKKLQKKLGEGIETKCNRSARSIP